MGRVFRYTCPVYKTVLSFDLVYKLVYIICCLILEKYLLLCPSIIINIIIIIITMSCVFRFLGTSIYF